MQWGTYELAKGFIYSLFTAAEQSLPIPIPYKEMWVNGLSGGLAATCAVCANNPLEILRIRTQLLEAKNKKDLESIRGGYWKLGLTILREEGWHGIVVNLAFYRGLRVRLVVTVPSAMVALSGYESIKWYSADK